MLYSARKKCHRLYIGDHLFRTRLSSKPTPKSERKLLFRTVTYVKREKIALVSLDKVTYVMCNFYFTLFCLQLGVS